ncbi:glycosyltransferase family 2 protein [Aeromonas caviae]|uniref:glycosyltransferase family 2 protein n=1 Tax=Aeromonas caviae TaxID=648 RepID=UPI002B49456B|nr:glycosyltransferase family 2 protein [Aeromonas caviae]
MNELTLVIPVYNAEKHLSELFYNLSRLNDIKVIFVNDGSSDSSQALIEQWLSEESDRGTSYYQRNKGVSSARNIGLLHVKTKYVLFLDSDDLLFTENLYVAIKKIKESKVDVFLCEYKKTASKCTLPDKNDINIITHPVQDYISGLLTDKVSLCSCVFSVDFLRREKISFEENIKYGEDQLFLSQTLLKGNAIYLSGLQVLLYFNNPLSVMNTFSLSRMDVLKSLNIISDLIQGNPILLKKIDSRYNRELVGIMTIYTKSHSLFNSFLFYKYNIRPMVRSNKDYIKMKDYVAIEYPYVYMSLYKTYRVLKNVIK